MKKELASVKGEVELLRTMLDAAKQQLQEHRSAGSSGSSGYNTLGDDSQCGGAPVQQNEEGGHNHVMHDHVMSPMDSNDSVAPRPVRLFFSELRKGSLRVLYENLDYVTLCRSVLNEAYENLSG